MLNNYLLMSFIFSIVVTTIYYYYTINSNDYEEDSEEDYDGNINYTKYITLFIVLFVIGYISLSSFYLNGNKTFNVDNNLDGGEMISNDYKPPF